MTGSDLAAEEPSLGRRAARGAFVTYLGQGSRIIIQVLSVIVLARLLDPGDYGLMAMVLAVVGAAEVFRDFGLSSAAVQAKTLSTQQRTNLFWINTGIGVALGAAVFASAGLISALYDRVELIAIAQTLSLTFVFNGMSAQFRADLNRRLLFARLIATDILSLVAGLAVGITGAALGWGYWALVAQQLTQTGVMLLAAILAARWLPGLPRRGARMRPLLKFGGTLVVTQLIGYVSNNLDSAIIGARFGAAQLGLYNRSFQLLMSPLGQLRAPTTSVALPILARLHDDPPRYGRFVARGQLALGYTLVAGLGLVIGAADPLILFLLGDDWAGVAPILRLLAIAGAFQTLAYVGYWVYLSRGLTGALLRYSLMTSAIKSLCIVGGSFFGVIGVAVGYVVAHAIEWPISLVWLSRLTVLPTRDLIQGALRILVVTTTIAAVTYGALLLVHDLVLVAQLAVAIVSALAAFALIMYAVPAFRRDAGGIVDLIKMVRAPRRA